MFFSASVFQNTSYSLIITNMGIENFKWPAVFKCIYLIYLYPREQYFQQTGRF